jgi:hypothetical protein
MDKVQKHNSFNRICTAHGKWTSQLWYKMAHLKLQAIFQLILTSSGKYKGSVCSHLLSFTSTEQFGTPVMRLAFICEVSGSNLSQ